MKAILFTIVILICLSLTSRAYEVVIERPPALDAGPFLFFRDRTPADGTLLLDWLQSESVIKRILIEAPSTNKDQIDFSEQYIRNRFALAKAQSTKKEEWHFAPLTHGTIYFEDGKKARIDFFLSGILINGVLFAP